MKTKNIWLAVFLTLILGPFGLLYCSLSAGAVLIAAYYLFHFILPWETFVSIVFWYTIPTLAAFVLASPDSKTKELGKSFEVDQQLPLPTENTESKTPDLLESTETKLELQPEATASKTPRLPNSTECPHCQVSLSAAKLDAHIRNRCPKAPAEVVEARSIQRHKPENMPEPLPEPKETITLNGITYAKINDQWFEQ